MSPQSRTAELEHDPLEMGESPVESYPAHREVESGEELKNIDINDASEARGTFTDEELKDGSFTEKLAAFSAQERGGRDEEVRVNMEHDSRGIEYFDENNVRIDAATGKPALEMLMGHYEKTKSVEEQAQLRAEFDELNKLLLANPNTYILVKNSEYDSVVDGKKVFHVAYIAMDSERRISLFNVDHEVIEESSEDNEESDYELSSIGETEDADSFLSEANDNLSDLEVLPVPVAAELEEIEVGKDAVGDVESIEEVSESIQLDASFVSEKPVFVPNTKTETVNLITAQLTEEFGFTYELEEQTVVEISGAQLTADPVQSVEPIRIVFIDDVEKSSIAVAIDDFREQVTETIDIVANVSHPEMRGVISSEASQEVMREVAVAKEYEVKVDSVSREKSTTEMPEIAHAEVAQVSDEILISRELMEQDTLLVQVNQKQRESVSIIQTEIEEAVLVPVATIIDIPKSSETQVFEGEHNLRRETEISAKEETYIEKTEAIVVVKTEIPTIENKHVPVEEIKEEIKKEGPVLKNEQRDSARFEIQQSPSFMQEQEIRVSRLTESMREIEKNDASLISIPKNLLPTQNSLDRFMAGARSVSFAQYAEAVNDNTKDVEVLEDAGITMRRQLRTA